MMRRIYGIMRCVAVLLSLVGFAVPAATGADRKTDREIEAWLPSLLATARYANIEPSEGAYLRDMVTKLKVQRALEIGTSTGYSGIWIAMGLRETGGRLITVEIDPARHAKAREHFHFVGLADRIDARLGDALKEVPSVGGPLDLVFLDALKSDYLKYYEMVLPKMRRGGAIVAHNVKSHPKDMADFLERIQSDPKVSTEIVTPGRQGFSVSILK
jgi:predicted O-methyltransferase YrrM